MLCKKPSFGLFGFSKLLILVLLFFQSTAQQNPGLSLYQFNSSYANPASVGLNGESYFQIHYRNQWSQYQSTYEGSGSLGTQIANVVIGLDNLNLGAGLQYVNDLTPSGAGLQMIRSQFAYHLPIGNGTLSAGLQLGLATKSFDGRAFRYRDPNDPLLDELSGKVIAASSFDAGFGIMYATDTWRIGASMDHLNTPSFAFTSSTDQPRLLPMFQVNGGVNLEVSEQIVLNPFAQVRSYQGNFVGDIGMRVLFGKLFWLGGNFRSNDALSGMLGFSVWKKQLDVGYALDQTISNQSIKAPLSHEFFLRFNLPNLGLRLKSNKVSPVNTPRFKIN